MLAGLGVPLSEDALVIHVGASLGGWAPAKTVAVVCATYAGVVLSDMLTYTIGATIKRGGRRFVSQTNSDSTGKKASAFLKRWGGKVGFTQRFVIGFRGPICLAAAIAGIQARQFFVGSAIGALLTMSLQLTIGSFLPASNAYLVGLSLVAVPALVGQVIGPILSLVALLQLRAKRIATVQPDISAAPPGKARAAPRTVLAQAVPKPEP